MDEGRIAHEWSGAGFKALMPQDLEKLQLRPTTLDQGITRMEEKTVFPDAIHLKNFFFSYQRHQPDLDLSIPELDLLPYKDTHPMALSGGQKQRVAIASALAADAKIILLDEPTSGLDYTHMKAVSQLLQQLTADGKTILVSTHDPEFLSFCGDYELQIRTGTIAGFYQIKSHRE